jgi:hypothetical protein
VQYLPTLQFWFDLPMSPQILVFDLPQHQIQFKNKLALKKPGATAICFFALNFEHETSPLFVV